ncbi:MAG: TrkA C-terminal domain-containing protein, partial [Actinomycetota bacterium]|nr:TrkA C-terminal domain-containing protein [Actinomycetota bacterium]
PQEAVGKSLGQAGLRSKYGVTVVGIKRTGQDFTYATQDTVVEPDDVLIVAGRTKATEDFAELT